MAWIYLLVRHLFLSFCRDADIISYVRLLKSPALYYVSADYREDDSSLIQKRL